jgi:hypothetical protein
MHTMSQFKERWTEYVDLREQIMQTEGVREERAEENVWI